MARSDEILDAWLDRAHDDERWRAWFAPRAGGSAKRAADEVVEAAERHAARLVEAVRPRTRTKRGREMSSDLARRSRAAFAKIKPRIEAQVMRAARLEMESAVRDLERLMPGQMIVLPSASELRAAASAPFEGGTLRQWLDGLAAKVARTARERVVAGAQRGDSEASVRRRLAGRRGVAAEAKRDGASIARTAAIHAQAAARELVLQKNRGSFARVLYVAILDHRTTATCRALDGKVFPVGKGPRPPMHFNCRSTTVPILKGEQPPDRVTYAGWLRRQPRAVQDEALGKARARLWRSGRLALDGMVDQSYRPLTLDQIRRRRGLD